MFNFELYSHGLKTFTIDAYEQCTPTFVGDISKNSLSQWKQFKFKYREESKYVHILKHTRDICRDISRLTNLLMSVLTYVPLQMSSV